MKRPFGVLAENATADFALLLLEPVRSAEPARNSIGIAAAIASIADSDDFRVAIFCGVSGGAAAAGGTPGFQHIVRYREGFERDAELFLGALELVGAERLAMGLRGAGPGRRAVADGGLAGDQRRLVGFLRTGDRGCNRLRIMAVDQFGCPACGLEALHLIDGI